MKEYNIFLNELRLATSLKFVNYINDNVGNDFKTIKFDYRQTEKLGAFLVYIMTDKVSFHFLYLNDEEDGYWLNQMNNNSIEAFYKWIK